MWLHRASHFFLPSKSWIQFHSHKHFVESKRDPCLCALISDCCSPKQPLLRTGGSGLVKSHCQGDELLTACPSRGQASLITGPGQPEPEPQALEKAYSPVGLWLVFASLLSRGFPLFILSLIIQIAAGYLPFRLHLS